MDEEPVPAVALDQAGTFTRAQAVAGGWTMRQVRRRLTAGRWVTVAGAALSAPRQTIGPWQLAYAVVLTWPHAVVSHDLAAVLHGFPVDPPSVGTAIVRRPLHLDAPNLRTKRVPLPPEDIVRLGDVAITTRRRTAIDLLRTRPWSDARSLWAWLSTRAVLSLDDVWFEAERSAGKHGTPQLRRLIEASAAGSLSGAEDVLHDILRCGLLTGWRANVPITVDGQIVAVADVLFDEAGLILEVDGYAAHGDREAFQRDRQRQNRLVAAGYHVLRFTWADLDRRRLETLASIRAVLLTCGANRPS